MSCGQLKYTDTQYHKLFIEIENIRRSISDISCGYSHIISLLTDGRILGFGSNELGQLGNNGVVFSEKFEEISNARRLI